MQSDLQSETALDAADLNTAGGAVDWLMAASRDEPVGGAWDFQHCGCCRCPGRCYFLLKLDPVLGRRTPLGQPALGCHPVFSASLLPLAVVGVESCFLEPTDEAD